MDTSHTNNDQTTITIKTGTVAINGSFVVPQKARGVVLFVHGSGSSRFSPRNRAVAAYFQDHQLATLLIDLLTQEEEEIDEITRQYRFDIQLLTKRVVDAGLWLRGHVDTAALRLGLFGSSTGAAAALVAAVQLSQLGADVGAVVSRGGRPDLAGDYLVKVDVPTLLIVGAEDYEVIELNRDALEKMIHVRKKELVLIPGATHLFEEPGALEQVSKQAQHWFAQYLEK